MTDVDRLRALLTELNVSQRQAAALLRMDERTFRKYCSGAKDVPPQTFGNLRRAAAAAVVPVDSHGDVDGNR